MIPFNKVFLFYGFNGNSIRRFFIKKSILSLILLCLSGLNLYSVPVDSSTLHNKIMMGYQGWFTAAGDGNTLQNGNWYHWGKSNLMPNGTNLSIDMYPDLREFTPGELYNTTMTINGGPAPLFSSRHASTISRHFKWMREYGVDGVFMQRFTAVIQGNPTYAEHLNSVLLSAVSAAQTEGRVISIMYDVSGSDPSRIVQAIKDDWMNLKDNMGVINSDRYLKHNGKPVVAIWGFGFNDRDITIQNAQTIINWFKYDAPPQYRATVMGGTPTYWRDQDGFDVKTDPGWAAVFRSYDIISPWSVGRYKNYTDLEANRMLVLEPDKAATNALGKDYMPVVWPGFSWNNLNGGPMNDIPRDGGRFYWRQIYNAINAGNDMIYVAMFDEVDESTAMFKVAETRAQCPDQGNYLTLNADGFSLPSDWYLQLANETGKILRGVSPLVSQMPIGTLPPLPPPPVPSIIKVEYVSQNAPLTMTQGGNYSVTVSMKNTGNVIWPAGGVFRLGSQNPQDNTTWGMSRVNASADVSPGSVCAFVFNVKAPATTGVYNFQWKMVQDGVAWFGPITPNLAINVTSRPSGLVDRTNDAGATISSQYNDSPTGQEANKLFDNNINTKYLTNHNTSWVQHRFGGGKKYTVKWYTVTSAMDAPSGSSAPNIVQNSSFETGGTSPAGWTLGTLSNGSTDTASTGTSSLKINAGATPSKQAITLQANTNYTIKVWARASGVTAGSLVFDTNDIFDGAGQGQFLINSSNASVWTQFSGSFNSGAVTSLTLRAFSEGMNGTAYIDDVSVAITGGDPKPMDPASWTLSGSNNGTTWTVIDTKTGVNFSGRGETLEFSTSSNTTSYEYYRLDVTNGGGSALQYAEVELWGDATEGPVTYPSPTWSSNPVVKSNATVGVAYSGSLSGNASDPESNTLTFTKASGPTWLSVAANGTLSGTAATANIGLNTFTVNVSDGVNAAAIGTVNITVVADPYVAWKTTNSVTSDAADDDNDGIVNLMEFALGGNPKVADSSVKNPIVTKTASNFNFTFYRGDASVTYTVEKSNDLITWSPHVIVNDTNGAVGSNCTVLVSTTEMANGKLFLRLKVAH
jgi:hypothetical protein